MEAAVADATTARAGGGSSGDGEDEAVDTVLMLRVCGRRREVRLTAAQPFVLVASSGVARWLAAAAVADAAAPPAHVLCPDDAGADRFLSKSYPHLCILRDSDGRGVRVKALRQERHPTVVVSSPSSPTVGVARKERRCGGVNPVVLCGVLRVCVCLCVCACVTWSRWRAGCFVV